MAEYTKLSNDKIKELMSFFETEKIESISPMKGGQANSSFKITTSKGDYILSICDEKNIDEIKCLTSVLEYLEKQNFPTSRLVKTYDKKAFVKYQDKPVYLKKYMEGEVLKDLSINMVTQVGQKMADLHSLKTLDIMPKCFPYGIDSFKEMFETGFEHPYIDWLRSKHEFLKTSIDNSLPKSFIHGDIYWDNLLFGNDKLIAVLDFEEACYYFKLFDVGMCAVGCCSKNGMFDMKKVSSLLKGYQQESKLNSHEKEQLKIFMEYAAVAGSFWRFRQYNIKYSKKDMAQTYKELSNLADHIHDMDKVDFINFF